jgi:hypothetical protein
MVAVDAMNARVELVSLLLLLSFLWTLAISLFHVRLVAAYATNPTVVCCTSEVKGMFLVGSVEVCIMPPVPPVPPEASI